ncbi:MAG: hypothetical protein ACI4JB_09075, partial [Porcipelethomonas sp.]
MKLKKRILGVFSAAVCGINICLSGTGALVTEAADLVPGYDNVDNYVADCLLNGYISLETAEYEGSGFYNLEDPGLYIFEQVSEDIMTNEGISDPSAFRDLGADISAEALESVSNQQLYEIL